MTESEQVPYDDFDRGRLADYDPLRIEQAMRQHRAIYLNHLEVAAWIEGWAKRMETRGLEGTRDLREVAAHLRQADLVPDGPLLDGTY